MDEISESANWLRQLGVIGLEHRTRIDPDDGQPVGSMVYAFPVMAVLEQYRLKYLETGKTPSPVPYKPEDSRPGPKPSRTASSAARHIGGLTASKRQFDLAEDGVPILTAPKEQQKHDGESGGDASMQWHAERDDHRSIVGAGGGGEADADQEMQVPALSHPGKSKFKSKSSKAQRPAAIAPPSNGSNGNGHDASAAPPYWRPARPPADLIIETPEQKEAWKKASRLCTLYGQVVMRFRKATCCVLSHSDHHRAFKFFGEFPQTGAFYMPSVFINALLLMGDAQADQGGGYDDLWHCRSALNFGKFLAYVKSGRIESEIGRAGFKINAWRDLRMTFTQSELLFYGWSPDKIPVVRIEPDELWEANRTALNFYRDRNLPLPVEIQAIDK